MTAAHRYMKRALELASLGNRFVAPNPMVGAVLVYEKRIIGEGYHHRYGQPHAEVMAVNSVKEKHLISKATLYVTLEPCSHYGKTPPCAELIIRSEIPKVVVAMQDPFHEVSGRGIAMLREAGVEVICGVMEEEAKALNKHFIKQHTAQRPYVKLKWAESADAFIDKVRQTAEEKAFVFSSALRQGFVHRERSEYQSILVGYRTALLDNPSLTNRFCSGNQPLRLVLDPRLSLPKELKLFTDGKAKTIVFYDRNLEETPEFFVKSTDSSTGSATEYKKVKEKGLQRCLVAEPVEATKKVEEGNRFEVVGLDFANLLPSLFAYLREQKINSLYVEGGAKTLQMFIDSGLYDELERELSPISLGEGITAPKL